MYSEVIGASFPHYTNIISMLGSFGTTELWPAFSSGLWSKPISSYTGWILSESHDLIHLEHVLLTKFYYYQQIVSPTTDWGSALVHS